MNNNYWYTSPISILVVDLGYKTQFRLSRGMLVQGEVIDGDTKATSSLKVVAVENREVYGEVVLPLDRFAKFDIEHAYLED